MELRDLILIALPFIVAITLGVGFLLVFRERAAAQDTMRRRAQLAEPDLATPLRDRKPPERPWWGNPWLWLLVGVVFVLLGLYVWPGLFGGTFFFLPGEGSDRRPAVPVRDRGHRLEVDRGMDFLARPARFRRRRLRTGRQATGPIR